MNLKPIFEQKPFVLLYREKKAKNGILSSTELVTRG